MLENIKIENMNGILVVSSREVARDFNKSHKNVIRTIENLNSISSKLSQSPFFIESRYNDTYGRNQKKYLMTRDGFSLLVMGFTGKAATEWKIKYIEAFNKMENLIKDNQNKIQLPSDPLEIMKMLFQVEEKHEDKLKSLENKINYLVEDAFLSPSEYTYVSNLIRERIRTIKYVNSLENANDIQNKELFRAINKDVNSVANVSTRNQIRRKNFNDVIRVINYWEPSVALKIRLENLSSGSN